MPVELAYKDNLAETRERMAAFWKGEPLDRNVIWITAPRKEPLPGPPAPEVSEDPEVIWGDQNYRLAMSDAQFRGTYFGAEAMPAFQPQLGPGSLAVHLGSPLVLMPTTVWYNPCIDDLATGPDLVYDPEEQWWVWTLEMVRNAVEFGAGKFIVAFPDLIENLDTLASLRGAIELLTELVDAPGAIHRYQKQVLELYFRYYDELGTLLNLPENGSVFVTFPVWGPGRVCKLQCDMSAMISPEMFGEFVAPYLRAQCQRVDHPFYHLDGVDAICHLPALLEIPELHGIQWTPGAGKEAVHDRRWWPMYHEIQDAGKSIFVLGVPPDLVPEIVREFDRDLTYISTHCGSEDEATALLREIG